MEKLIGRGAEAEIYLSEWMGRDVVTKKRIKKKYRIKEIDEEMRRQRTKKEALLMEEARKSGTSVPIIYDVDLNEMKITMQYVNGDRIKDCIDGLDKERQKAICKKIGESIASLHKNGIIHGDITTSNLILANGNIYFIDFGLGEISNEAEKQGVDLHLLMGAFKAAHRNTELFQWVFEAYEKKFDMAGEIRKKMKEIAERGRYVVRE
ncbi:MAG: KEOPS complex kinase/ATPase Bud32 [Candidatus Thermoplasmatota archaeon]|nr:KEOPS complex kinase/ATPase Bud32 [Candidatus Thermoplasmatota archaeon]